jgi:hypothetical protein
MIIGIGTPKSQSNIPRPIASFLNDITLSKPAGRDLFPTETPDGWG